MAQDKLPSQDRIADLVTRFKHALGAENAETDANAPIRYVIYARKSTKNKNDGGGEGKQVESIPQQITVCKRYAANLGLRYVDIIPEMQSAKISDKRPRFREMLDAIKNGEYEGIIAWAPDRLARNMKEGGEIVDLLDHGIIRDLKFANGFTYTNNDSGKMLLGIAFVMAKQYSDQHSSTVNRSIKEKTNAGRWVGSHGKHGYYLDKQRHFRPDGRNFELVCEMFRRRLAKQSLKEIADYLVSENFPVKTPHKKHKPLKVNEKFVSDLLRDPFYAGIMIFGEHVVNLFDHYDFVPVITAEELDQLYREEGIKKDFKLAEAIKKRGDIKADLLRHMVICGDCNRPFSTGITPKVDKDGKIVARYFYYRCNTPGCSFRNKSVRAKVVIDAACDFLEAHPIANEEGYRHYVAEMERLAIANKERVERDLKSLKTQRQHAQDRAADMLELARKTLAGDEDIRRDYQRDHKEQLKLVRELNKRISELKHQQLHGTDGILAFAEFLELFNNLAKTIRKATTMSRLDFILKKLFSNFVVKDGKVVQITQNSPFRELCGSPNSAMVNEKLR